MVMKQNVKFLKGILTEEDLHSIERTIKEAENKTSGELRVKIIKTLFLREGIYKRAVKEFYRLGMQNTRGNTGVLILLALRQKKFQILADFGIHQKVGQATWDGIAQKMSELFKEGQFCGGICAGIQEAGEILAKYFPVKPDDSDELSDEVSVG